MKNFIRTPLIRGKCLASIYGERSAMRTWDDYQAAAQTVCGHFSNLGIFKLKMDI